MENLTLFISSFLSATLLPGAAEITLLNYLSNQGSEVVGVLIATLGNCLGSYFTYYIGRLGRLDWASKYLRIKKENVLKLKDQITKKGSLVSFFCFLPIIGDPLALALGYFKVGHLSFVVWMSFGKFIRFILVVAAGKPLLSMF